MGAAEDLPQMESLQALILLFYPHANASWSLVAEFSVLFSYPRIFLINYMGDK